MTDTLSPASGIDAAAPKGLAARMAGVIFSPGDTFRAIVAQPRVLGVLVVTTIIMAARCSRSSRPKSARKPASTSRCK